jgi:hypothetical protein
MGAPSAVAALETGATMLSAKSTKTETQLMAEEMLRATSRLQRDVEMEFMRQSAEFRYSILDADLRDHRHVRGLSDRQNLGGAMTDLVKDVLDVMSRQEQRLCD